MNGTKLTVDKAAEALRIGVAHGVQESNGVYIFVDPGISLVTLSSLPLVRERNLMYLGGIYERCDWAMREDDPQERTLRIPLANSFNKSFADQRTLVLADEEVPSARVIAMFLVIKRIASGTDPLPYCSVRCADNTPDGYRIDVGRVDVRRVRPAPFGIGNHWEGDPLPTVGLASTLKS